MKILIWSLIVDRSYLHNIEVMKKLYHFIIYGKSSFR
jgi:hypothetical protein